MTKKQYSTPNALSPAQQARTPDQFSRRLLQCTRCAADRQEAYIQQKSSPPWRLHRSLLRRTQVGQLCLPSRKWRTCRCLSSPRFPLLIALRQFRPLLVSKFARRPKRWAWRDRRICFERNPDFPALTRDDSYRRELDAENFPRHRVAGL